MHRDLARYLVLLTVVRVLVAVATPATHPWPIRDRDRHVTVHPQGTSCTGTAGRVEHFLHTRRTARPRLGGPAVTGRGCGGGDPAPGGSADRPLPADRSLSAVGRPLPAPGLCRPPGSVPAGRCGRRGGAHRGRRSRHRQRGSRGGRAWTEGSGCLMMCTLNIQSIKPKTVELNRELQRFRYDITVLCESWLRPNVPSRLLAFPGYSLHRSEANIIKKKDKLLGRFIPYFTCKIWNKNTQYVVLFKHDMLGIFIPYFTRKIWNKTTQ